MPRNAFLFGSKRVSSHCIHDELYERQLQPHEKVAFLVQVAGIGLTKRRLGASSHLVKQIAVATGQMSG